MSDLYELPNGWEWKKLTEVVIIGCDKGFKPTVSDGKVPFIGMTDIDEDKGRDSKYVLKDYEKVSKGKTKFQKNAVLVGKITPCTQNNKTTIVPSDIDGGFATTEVYALHTMDNMTPLYLNYFIRSNKINEYLVSTMIGATGRQRVPSDTIKNLDIPLPPLSEQQRIVSKLDLLFEKIDKSIALHQKNMDEADIFIGSVLNDVFGELEEKYENDILKNISNIISGYAFKSSDFSNYNEIKSIKITNVGVKEFVEDEENRLSKDLLEKLSKYTVNSGDIVIALTRPYISNGLKVTFVPNSYNGAFVNQRVAAIQSKNNISLINYIYYYLCTSNILTNVMELSKTLNQPNLSIKDLSNFEIPTPPLNIQQKVVKYLDEVSEKIEKVKSVQKEKMDSLIALKASILDRAFRGEL